MSAGLRVVFRATALLRPLPMWSSLTRSWKNNDEIKPSCRGETVCIALFYHNEFARHSVLAQTSPWLTEAHIRVIDGHSQKCSWVG